MTKKLRALLKRKQVKLDAARVMVDADAEMSEDGVKEYDAIMAEVDSITESIKREQILADQENDMPAVETDDPVTSKPAAENFDNHGFKTFGEFSQCLIHASQNAGIDERLKIGAATPTTYGNEGTGADGGFLVPPEYSRDVWSLSTSLESGSLLPLTDNMPINSNSMVFPSDETTPWGTDGVRGYWDGEAEAATQTKIKITPNSMRMHKLMALVPMTDELMADSTGLGSYLMSKVSDSIMWKVNDSILVGTGAGMPLGIAGSAGEISVSKESGQAANTIVTNNIAKMYARMPARMRRNAVWVVNDDTFPQILVMTLGNNAIYMPPQEGFRNAPDGMLLGKGIISSESAKTLGTKGDINLIDFSSYRTITKSGGIESATSMHLYFDSAAIAFRSIFRMDGQPIVKTPISPANGSATKSPYVTLATRA